MKLVDIILVKSDPIINQSSIRAVQIIRSLSKRYSVIALGWNRHHAELELTKEEKNLNLFDLRAPYGYEAYGKLLLVAYFPIFWVWVFFKLCVHRPKIVHACDLATVLPCYIYKLLFRRKLIFDVLDRYGMTYLPKNRNFLFKMLHSLVNSLEEFFARNSDVLLAVSDRIFLTFKKKPENCVTVMNCPEEHLINVLRLDTDLFRLLFTGAIRTGRGLEVIRDIVTELKDVQLDITGKIKDVKLSNELAGMPNIKYHGFLHRDNLLDLETKCDVMIALYDLKMQNQYEYGMANKVLEAMMCSIPVITNISHELLDEARCGISVEYDNVEQIKNAIITLRDDPNLRKFYGNNGRKAYLQKYNWTKMEEKLFNIYQQLLSDKSKAENSKADEL